MQFRGWDHFAENFWACVDRSSSDSSCWNWVRRGRRGAGGYYGATTVWLEKGWSRAESAHRVAWFLTFGSLPIGELKVLHKCDNGLCCNPSHLYLGTAQRNSRDEVERMRHPKAKFNPEQVREIRAMFPTLSQSEIARRLSVNSGTICRIVNNKTFSWVSQNET